MRSEKPCNPAEGYCLQMKSADPHRCFASAVPCDRVHDLEKRRFRNCVIFYKGDPVASLRIKWNGGIFCKAGLRVDRPYGLVFDAATVPGRS